MGNLTMVIPPAHLLAVPVERFLRDVDPEGDEKQAAERIQRATTRVEKILRWRILRGQWKETLRGLDRLELELGVRPLASLDAVTCAGEAQALGNFKVTSRDLARVYSPNGFLRSSITRLDYGYDPDPALWSFTTTAGYFVPDDDLTASISVNATDSSYNSAAGVFSTLLRPGDSFEAFGWEGAELANNGPRVVVTATANKITTSSGLVTATAANRTLSFATDLPGEITDAVLLLASEQHHVAGRDPTLTGERIEGVSELTWSSTSGSGGMSAAEQSATAILAPLIRKRSAVEVLRA